MIYENIFNSKLFFFARLTWMVDRIHFELSSFYDSSKEPPFSGFKFCR